MPDYGLKYNKLEIISGSIYLYPSSSATDPSTAISASVPQILAITCSSNLNNRLIPPNNTSSYSIISFSEGNNAQRLVLRYISGSYDNNNKIKSVTPTKYLYKSTGARDKYVDIPILNNDDSLTIAFKTVNALQKTGGYNNYFSASLDIIGKDEIGSTGVGSITIEDDFIVDQYPGGTGLSSYSSSLGVNQSIGSSFRIRAGEGIGDVSIGGGFIIGDYETFGSFKIYNFLSGSVGKANFSGSRVQLGGMMIGSSFKMGGNNELFSYNVVQEGSGIQNQPFYEGKVYNSSASLGLTLDPDDNSSGLITGSGDAKFYMSSSGRLGFNTTNPNADFDVRADKFRFQTKAVSKGVQIDDEGNLESFNNEITSATTGSELILSYARGGSGSLSNDSLLSALCLVVARGDDDDNEECNHIKATITGEYGSDVHATTQYIEATYGDTDITTEIYNTAQDLGLFNIASAGDTIGSLRWKVNSGSEAALDKRQAGAAASITTVVEGSDSTGVTSNMLFKIAKTKTAAPTEIMRIGADGNVHITGSLIVSDGTFTTVTSSVIYSSGSNTFGDAAGDTHTFTGAITASGDISASGNIIGTINGGTF